jgi:hypothetical protein|eukprot:COSAG01_NODE_1018_length_12100_cov_6.251562_5_plen_47_part_00
MYRPSTPAALISVAMAMKVSCQYWSAGSARKKEMLAAGPVEWYCSR